MKPTVYHRQGLRLLDAINFSIVYILGSGMTCEFVNQQVGNTTQGFPWLSCIVFELAIAM